MPETRPNIWVQCGCGAKLRAPASAAGQNATCPKCGNRLTVPSSQQAPAARVADQSDQSDPMYDLVEADRRCETVVKPADLRAPRASAAAEEESRTPSRP